MNQSRDAIDIAGEAGDDAAGFEVGKLAQGKAKKPLEKPATEAHGDFCIENVGAVAARGIDRLLEHQQCHHSHAKLC